MKRSLSALLLVIGAVAFPSVASTTEAPVVIALIDSGINPYAPAFRDADPIAMQPPSTYLPGYPADCPAEQVDPTTTCAKRLELTLDAANYAEAWDADRAMWDNSEVFAGQLYYVPGTRIVGLVSFGAGGTRCPRKVGRSQVGYVEATVPPPGSNSSSDCPERLLLDDHGHGTMTASRAAGAPSSLAPTARIVEIEGLGSNSSRWAGAQPWIDVQSNSWGSLVPAPADIGNMTAFNQIAKEQFVVVASGNGIGFSGLAPTPTQMDGLGAPGVILVGGHDNGRVTAWHGIPAHVVADAYGGQTAPHDTLGPMAPSFVACCTSTSAPYAAGGAAAILQAAREILGEARTGMRVGVVAGQPAVIAAEGPAGLVADGPLKDGIFTLDEWRRLYMVTAQARPTEGRDDGLLHYFGEDEPTAPRFPEYGTADNPYCQLCWTLPLKWADVSPDVPAYLNVGYGAINESSGSIAADVLEGNMAAPARPDEDEYFAAEDQVRRLVFTAP